MGLGHTDLVPAVIAEEDVAQRVSRTRLTIPKCSAKGSKVAMGCLDNWTFRMKKMKRGSTHQRVNK
ncbi:hypothetical protein ColTof4_09588 [Colletotrichum tofieldiae]|nr:hypothetical protein ColTof3_04938 [Colletotrichum tofieldiae]GKT77165.1 hypothetical protein ColTof4_09588 [Colletotrichum tofieldiae]